MAIDDKVNDALKTKAPVSPAAIARAFHDEILAGMHPPHPVKTGYVHPIERITADRRSYPEIFLYAMDYGDHMNFGDTQYTAEEGILRVGSKYAGQTYREGKRTS